LYGYTVMFRETGNPIYLNHANHIARFILGHANLPTDKVPYWDFNAPGIPAAPRDVSAGAIICSALLELAGYVDQDLSEKYLKTAEKMLVSMMSPSYFTELGGNGGFLLKHGVG